jgi:hypothetical protein
MLIHVIQPFEWMYFSNLIKINNWRVFMMACALPSLISALSLLILPESPKFYLYVLNLSAH